MKITLICTTANKNRMLSNLYFRNHLFQYIHIRVDNKLGDHVLRVVMYMPIDAMPGELIEWIYEQPNAVRVFITA
jgi:hypothetical protein